MKAKIPKRIFGDFYFGVSHGKLAFQVANEQNKTERSEDFGFINAGLKGTLPEAKILLEDRATESLLSRWRTNKIKPNVVRILALSTRD